MLLQVTWMELYSRDFASLHWH